LFGQASTLAKKQYNVPNGTLMFGGTTATGE